MKKLLIFTSLALVLAGCSSGEASKTKPNPFKNDTTTSSKTENNGGSGNTKEKKDVFEDVLKNAEKYMNDGTNTTDDKYLEYKNIQYFKIKTDKEYLVLSGEQYIKGTDISSGLKAVRFLSYDSETKKVEKAIVSGFPIQALLIGDSSKAGAYNTALREKNSNIMPRAIKGKLVQNNKGNLAYITESMGGERYSLEISNNKVNLEKIDSAVPGNEKDLVESGEKEVVWAPVSGESEKSATEVTTTKAENNSPKIYVNDKGKKLTLYNDGKIIDSLGQDHNTKREERGGKTALISDRVVGSSKTPTEFILEGNKIIIQHPMAPAETYTLEK